MSTPGQVTGATQQAAGQTASATKDEAAQVASTATAAAADVAGTAKEQAGTVAGEAISQVRDLLDQTKAQVSEQAGGAQDKLGASLRSLSDELRSMGEGSGSGSGPAAELARTVAERGTAFADYLSSKEPGELVTELRALASRKPGGFLLGALVAGAAVGRLVRGASAAASDDSASRPIDRTPAPPVAMPVLPPVVEVAPMPTVDASTYRDDSDILIGGAGSGASTDAAGSTALDNDRPLVTDPLRDRPAGTLPPSSSGSGL